MDFAISVRALAGEAVHGWAIDKAIQHYRKLGKTRSEHESECVALARGIVLGFSRQEVEEVGGLPPSIELDSRRLAEGLRADVERIRKALFGSVEPPFKDLTKAGEWIESTAKRYKGLAKCSEWFPYPVPGKHMVERAPGFVGSPLEQVAQFSRRLAGETGLHQAAVVAFTLAGIPPILPPARISIHRRFAGGFSHTWATIELHAGDLTFAQVRRLYNKVRQRMGTTRKKALADRDIELLELAQKIGEPPKKHPGNRGAIREYWQRFEKEWNRAHRKERLTWRAAQNRYERLRNKRAFP